ncbi:MAG: hypothetical protein M0Z94_10990 [Dehalococcoidales bacterium]|nr:hypothetical protein [Dehalococcoidales bacterium]
MGASRKSDWLALFPEAAAGELGQAFADPNQDPLWRETWTAPLHRFFEKPPFQGTEERFAARCREIEKRWG